jgi:hypothetical protein
MTIMSIVVTGATGQLGRLTVEALLRRGIPAADIIATGRDIAGIKDLADRGITSRCCTWCSTRARVWSGSTPTWPHPDSAGTGRGCQQRAERNFGGSTRRC